MSNDPFAPPRYVKAVTNGFEYGHYEVNRDNTTRVAVPAGIAATMNEALELNHMGASACSGKQSRASSALRSHFNAAPARSGQRSSYRLPSTT